MSTGSPTHRVLLVREWDQQTTGSGCCGRLEGGDSEMAGAADFTVTRVQMERMGAVYRALVAELSDADVDIQVVDPRNLTFLVPALIRDAWHHGRSWRNVLHQLRTGVAQGAIVVDGRVVASGEIPRPDQAVGLVLRALEPAHP